MHWLKKTTEQDNLSYYHVLAVEIKLILHVLCTHYCLFVSCNLDKWYNIKLKVVESQAVGRRKQAKGASLSAGDSGAPNPLTPAGARKTPELYFSLLGSEALCIVDICTVRHLYCRLWGR